MFSNTSQLTGEIGNTTSRKWVDVSYLAYREGGPLFRRSSLCPTRVARWAERKNRQGVFAGSLA